MISKIKQKIQNKILWKKVKQIRKKTDSHKIYFPDQRSGNAFIHPHYTDLFIQERDAFLKKIDLYQEYIYTPNYWLIGGDHYIITDIFIKNEDIFVIVPIHRNLFEINHNYTYLEIENTKYEPKIIVASRDYCIVLKFESVVNLQVKFASVKLYIDSKEKQFKINSFNQKYHYLSMILHFKDDISFLKRYLEHHIKIGFNHFYLYLNLTANIDNLFQILQPFIESNQVSIIAWPFPFCNQYGKEQAQTAAINHSLHGYSSEYMAHFDLDEFIFPMDDSSILGIIEKYEKNYKFGVLSLCCQWFGCGYQANITEDDFLIKLNRRKREVNAFQESSKIIFHTERTQAVRVHDANTEHPYLYLSPSEVRFNHYRSLSYQKRLCDCTTYCRVGDNGMLRFHQS